MLSHELRNPLAPITNAVHVLAGDSDAKRVEWARDIMSRQLKHLVRLVDDLLDVSRITQGKIELRFASSRCRRSDRWLSNGAAVHRCQSSQDSQ